jgi:hypothetical protein
MSQSDYGFNKLNTCLNDRKFMLSFHENYTEFCTNLCPIDCISDEYFITIKYQTDQIFFDPRYWKFTVEWDDSKPLIINKETPVMTFTDYFCLIGDLFGMWFGISANQLLDKLIHNRVRIHFLATLINNLLGILESIKRRIYSYFLNISYVQSFIAEE